MFQNLSLSYPTWFLLLCVLVGFIWSFLMYYKDSRFTEKATWIRALLFGLRFLSAALIAFLLLNPLLTSQKSEQKDPIIVFLDDKSESIPLGMSKNQLDQFNEDIKKGKESLGDKYELVNLSFGAQTQEAGSDSFNQKATNIADAINYVYDNYADQNVGALVLLSDGIYNEGANPLYLNANFNAPIHTFGLGDTSIRKDIVIKNVLSNKIAYLGDKFSLQIDIAAYNAAGINSKLTVEKITANGRSTVASEQIAINSGNFFISKSFVLDADVSGILRYEVSVGSTSNEVSYANNKRDFYIEVIDARQKILILANSPHPDLAALQDLITNNKNYEVKVVIYGESGVDIANTDLIIYHNLPSKSVDITTIETAVNKKGISKLFIVGSQTDPARLNALQDVIKVNGNATVNEIIEPNFIAGFDKFTLSDPLKSRLGQYPPLLTLFGNYKAGDLAHTLFNQKVKKVPTKNPMMSFEEKAGSRIGVFVGEGIWKWRMQDMIDFKNADLSGELINKTIQYLSVKDDKRKFRVNTSKNLYKENETVLFDAQLYNDAFEMINTPDVQLTLNNQAGKKFEYVFSKTENYYTLNAGVLPAGDYSYEGKTNFGGKVLDAKGRFSVQNIQLETNNLTADHNLLRGLSSKYGGVYKHFSQAKDLESLIMDANTLKPTIYTATTTQPLLNHKWLFFLILLALTAEWFIRRYMGNY